MQEFSAGNKNINKGADHDQSDECFLPAENSHMRMRNKIKTNRDKSSIPQLRYYYDKTALLAICFTRILHPICQSSQRTRKVASKNKHHCVINSFINYLAYGKMFCIVPFL